MAQIIGARTTNQAITETRLVRYVGEDMVMLDPEVTPLITFLTKLGAKSACTAPRIEWFEDDYVARWAQNGSATVAANTGSTTVTVTDGTLFVAGDVFIVPQAISSSTAPEQVLVSSVSSNTLTVVRAFAGSTVQSIDANAAIAILGQAHAEGGTPPNAKTTAPVAKISYTQIFKKTINLTKTQVASKVYAAANGDRMRLHEKVLKEIKIDMNRAFLFGKAAEDLTGSAPIRTTMGLNSVIATNVTNASGTLTKSTFEAFARSAFRYGKGEKLLLAAPTIISAISSWGTAALQLRPGEKQFGVNIQRLTTGHGDFMVVRDWLLEDGVAGKNGFSGWAFSIDTELLDMKYLSDNGESRDTQIQENVIQDGRDAYVDQVLGEVGFCIKNEKAHAKLFNVTGYSA